MKIMGYGFGEDKGNDPTERLLKDLDVDLSAPEMKPLCDPMARRDNYFHSCWVMFKMENRHLCVDMDRIEMIIAGYDPDYKEPEPELDEEGNVVPVKKRVIL